MNYGYIHFFPLCRDDRLIDGTLLLGNIVGRRIAEPLVHPLEEISSAMEGWKAVDNKKLDARVLKALVPSNYLSERIARENQNSIFSLPFMHSSAPAKACIRPSIAFPGPDGRSGGTTRLWYP